MATDNGAIGWDDEVDEKDTAEGGSNHEDFVLLPDGIYPFTVNKMERGTYNGSDKLPPCNMVRVGIIVDGGEKGRSYVSKMFFMHTKTLGMIYDFMSAIGLHKKGSGKTAIPWSKVEAGLNDLGGKVKLYTRKWQGRDGEVVCNDVKAWITKTEEPKTEKSGNLDDLPF